MSSVVGAFFTKAYDAIVGNKRRRKIAIDLRSEDRLLLPLDRDQLVSNGHSLRRNAAVVAWAIRKHLDYVSTFSFQCRSGRPELDKQIEALMNWYQRPTNCDASGRYSLPRLVRMLEGLATTTGDAFLYKLRDGRLQLIEGDRVRTPGDFGTYTGTYTATDFLHGVQVDGNGRPIRFAVCDRTGGMTGPRSFVLREIVPAGRMYQHGYFDRYDQLRGVSPLSSAMNTFFDVYEAAEFALARMKLAQLFGLKIKRASAPADDDGSDYEFDFGAGPQLMDLDPGDDAEFLESKSPTSEFQAFMQTGIGIGLKALDIPFSFWDESWSTYSGSRQALLQYEQSADSKRDNLKQLLNNLTVWRLSLFIADGELQLPAGVTLDDLKFEWIPGALPWIDPVKEVTANVLAIKAGLKSRQMICKEQGEDFFTVADQIKAENDYLGAKGLSSDVDNITADQLGAILNADNADAAGGKRKAGATN